MFVFGGIFCLSLHNTVQMLMHRNHLGRHDHCWDAPTPWEKYSILVAWKTARSAVALLKWPDFDQKKQWKYPQVSSKIWSGVPLPEVNRLAALLAVTAEDYVVATWGNSCSEKAMAERKRDNADTILRGEETSQLFPLCFLSIWNEPST